MSQVRASGRNAIGWTVAAVALGAVAGAVASNRRTLASRKHRNQGIDTWWHGYATAVKDNRVGS